MPQNGQTDKVRSIRDLEGFDGVVTVNWANPWSTSATAAGVPMTEYDFDSTMSHELLHAVGFLSSMYSDNYFSRQRQLELPGFESLLDGL